jgi:Ca2+-binding RTX toxin-like protein
VTSAGATASTGGARAQAISGFTTGGTFNQTALLGTAQNVTLSGAAFSAGLTDTFNLGMTGTDGYANAGSLTLADIETLAITTTDSDTTAAATAFDANIDATSVKTVTVTGNAGMTFANSNLGTALTSFNASGVTVGPVTYTAGALAAAATFTGGAGDDTLSGASSAVAGVTVHGGAGNDTITGSATKASTLNGDAGNDSITGGAAADVIDGGIGTNTYVFSSTTVAEQEGSGTTSGVVINLSAAALTSTAVNTATALFVSALQTSVASGSSTYLFSNESNTNASVIDTLANINNATGSNLADYIVGSATANTITGGAGGDFLTGGAGADTFVATTRAESLVAAALDGTAFDSITDFLSGTDKLDLAGTLTLTAAVDGATNLNASTQAWDTNMNTTVAAAVTALGANAFANVGDVIVLTITGGTAAQNGVWVVQNIATAAFAIADDLAIKLVGTSSTTLAVGDFL